MDLCKGKTGELSSKQSLYDRALKFIGIFSWEWGQAACITCSTLNFEISILKPEKRFLPAKVAIFGMWIFLAIWIAKSLD